jgi:hypothetical protein
MHETLQAFIQCVSGPTFSNNRYWQFIWEMQGLRVRTISYFVPSVPTDEAGWTEHIEEAAVFLRKAQDMFENAGERQSKTPCRPAPLHADALVIKGPYAQPLMKNAGYEVQTVRIVTRALSAAASASDATVTASLLEQLCLGNGISFLSLGATSSERLLQDGVFCRIAAATSHTSCSFRCRLEAFVHMVMIIVPSRRFHVCLSKLSTMPTVQLAARHGSQAGATARGRHPCSR